MGCKHKDCEMKQPECIDKECYQQEVSAVASNDGLCATTHANLKGEILDRMNHFYLQTDGTHKWPNNAEGDLLKMAHKLISA